MNAALETAAASLAALIDPKLGAAVELAPVAIQLMQSAMDLHKAGVLPPEQVIALFASVGRGIQATHDQWAALNAAGK